MMRQSQVPSSNSQSVHHSKQNVHHRVIAHFDVDAFYVACERELRPELLREKPVAVSQYNPYGDLRSRFMDDDSRIFTKQRMDHPDSNGSLIAVSYEARAKNVRRNDRGKDAMEKCPELIIVQVPVKNGKADLTIYRDASERLMKELAHAIQDSTLEIYHKKNDGTMNCHEALVTSEDLQKIKVEKASIDEVYIDLSIPVKHIFQKHFGDKYSNTIKNNKTHHGSNAKKENNLEPFMQLMHTGGADIHTTIGGLETSKEAIAANSLSKDDIRKGSSLQVLDSNHIVDSGSNKWWRRPLCDWEEEEIYLAIGATITYLARTKVLSKFDSIFTLSAGVSLNKLMAKLASGLKKPNRQTLINPTDRGTLQKLFYPLPIGRIRGLGGKFGESVSSTLNVTTVGELAKVSLPQLLSNFSPDQANFMYGIARGLCKEEVSERTKSKSIGAGKTFRGALSFSGKNTPTLRQWIRNLMQEVMERLQSDPNRHAKTLVVSISFQGKKNAVSQSASLTRHGTLDTNTEIAMTIAQKLVSSNKQNSTVTTLSISATNIINVAIGSSSIQNAFNRISSPQKISTCKANTETQISTPKRLRLDHTPQDQNMKMGNEQIFPGNSFVSEIQLIPKKEENDLVSNAQNKNDNDLEYAKALQASFDRENEVLLKIERKHTLSHNFRLKAPENLSVRHGGKCTNINMFFKKRKR